MLWTVYVLLMPVCPLPPLRQTMAPHTPNQRPATSAPPAISSHTRKMGGVCLLLWVRSRVQAVDAN